MILEFSGEIFEKHSISNVMKIRPGGAELFRVVKETDGQK
jgi:hypothetical protein